MPNLPPELSPEKRMSHLDELFRTLDPERLGAGYAAARRAQDVEESIRQVARHFRSRPRRLPDDDPGFLCYDADRAERAVRGEVEVVNIPWKFPDGRIDFLFDPTAIHGPVNHEWVWQLNRHGYWGDMARAFAAGGDGRYARQFNIQLRDWIARTDCPADWNAPGSAWRTIETGLRLMGAWPVAFEFFRCSPFFTDENLCLMLASMHRQAVHLASHPTSGNWLLMEMNGLYTFATLFPEFRTAAGFRELSARTLSGALRGQLLPDGMHDELSPDYHSVVFRCGCAMYRLAGLYHQAGELPPDSIMRVHNDTLKKPSELGVPLPPQVEQAIMKALAVKAEDRFSTMEAFIEGITGKTPASFHHRTMAVPSGQTAAGSDGKPGLWTRFRRSHIGVQITALVLCDLLTQRFGTDYLAKGAGL